MKNGDSPGTAHTPLGSGIQIALPSLKPPSLRSLILLLIALICSAHCTRAQDSTLVTAAQFKIFIEPVSLIDIYDGPCVRLGAEVPLFRRFSCIGTYGMYGDGYYVKGGIKRYQKKDFGSYFELCAFYKNNTRTVHDNVENFPGSNSPQVGAVCDYTVARNVWGINAEIGAVIWYWRHWTLDGYGGAGVRFRNIATSISDSLQQTLYDYNEGSVARVSYSPTHNQTSITLTAGIRFGYCFRRAD